MLLLSLKMLPVKASLVPYSLVTLLFLGHNSAPWHFLDTVDAGLTPEGN